MELRNLRIENQRQEMTIPCPEIQLHDVIDIYPEQGTFAVFPQRGAGKSANKEDEAEPVFAVLAETRPTDGSSKRHSPTLEP